ncbi:MAG: histidinol-phosphate transaminase [Candidatus Thioglobus sp.]|nr:MAG: histidinol-phosphate transaminase [Candidatus Thioglobus sp.]
MSACAAILALEPYQGGKPIGELQRELGLNNVVKLASNENPLPTNPKVIAAIEQAASEVGRYPDGNGFALKQALSQHLSVAPEMITLGNGSNDLLELIARAYICSSSDEVIFSEYAFVVYPLITQALGATAIITPAQNFGHNLTAMLLAISKNTKLIFIANPNNPTGTMLSDKELYEFLSKVTKRVIIVLDQAYIEYLGAAEKALEWLQEFDNLVITRTFSKAYGLAGLRVGYSICSVQIADYLNRIRQPFNVNNIAQSAAIAALKDGEFMRKSVAQNQSGLSQLAQGFDELGLEYIPSSANFIALKVTDAKGLYHQLLQRGFIVRLVEMPNYIRVSVGTKNENGLFLNALKLCL